MRDRLLQQRARSLRNDATDVERYLWKYLKRKQLAGARFRRQAPIDNYIADFVCFEAKLVIELDGSQHMNQRGYDTARDVELALRGFRVLRFWNNDVFNSTESVLEQIVRELAR